MKIGNLEIKGNACLAPMAGVADTAMRKLCIGYGAGYVVGELVSAKGISNNDRKSNELLNITPEERPMAVQIFGNDPDTVAKASVCAMENHPDFIDINMGCPAPKVANNGSGSALMKNPELAAKIVEKAVKSVDVPITVKMRTGWDENSINCVELAKLCEQAGASAITVHGRTRKQMYAPPVNTDIIKEVKNAVNIPVIANGDIRCADDAAQMYLKTGCDYVMVGRAACGAPWIFMQINAYLNETRWMPEPPVSERMLVLLKQVKMMVDYKGEFIAMKQARKHAAFYMKGIKGANSYRRECGTLNTYSDLERLCYKVFCEHKDD